MASYSTNAPDPWVAVGQVADHLDVTKDTVYRWIDQEGLPARKVGRLLRFRLREIDAWVEAGARLPRRSPSVWSG